MRIVLTIIALIVIAFFVLPFFVVNRPVMSPANICFNNLHNIDLAKNIWALENKKATNDLPTWDDIKKILARDKPYYQSDPTNNLSRCPLGGVYKVGHIGEPPTCSLGTTVTPAHVLP